MGRNRFKKWTVSTVCIALMLTTCTGPPRPTATSRPPLASTATVSPGSAAPAKWSSEAIVELLAPAASLSQAVDQFAGALGTTKDSVLVRVHAPTDAGFCYDCDRLPPEYAKWEHEGVSLDDVPTSIAPGSAIWLVLEAMACRYSYDGNLYTPRFCEAGSSSESKRP